MSLQPRYPSFHGIDIGDGGSVQNLQPETIRTDDETAEGSPGRLWVNAETGRLRVQTPHGGQPPANVALDTEVQAVQVEVERLEEELNGGPDPLTIYLLNRG